MLVPDSFKEAQLDAQTVTGQNRAQVNAVKHQKGRGGEKHRRERSASSSSGNDDNECKRCGRDHEDERCPFVSAICHKCGKVGHIKSMCRERKKGRNPKFNKIMSEQSGNSGREFDVLMRINGKDVEMSIDSGSDISYISERTWRLVGSPRARHTNVTPVCTNGSIFHVTGKCEVDLEMNGTIILGEVYITEEMDVLGKDYMQSFFTLMPKRPQAQLSNSIGSVESKEVNERLHSGTGIVTDKSRNHSMRAIEGAELVEDPYSGNGLRNGHHDLLPMERTLERSGGSASLTRSSLQDDSPKSEERVIGDASRGEKLQMAFHLTSTDEDAVVNCASENDRTIFRSSLKDDSNQMEVNDRSLEDDSYHSEKERLGDAEAMGRRLPMAFHLISTEIDAVQNCGNEKDREIHTSVSERGSSLRYELEERVVTGSHSGLRECDQMGAGKRHPERDENGKSISSSNVAPRRQKPSRSDATRRFAYHSSTREEPADYESTPSETSPSKRAQEEDNTVAQCQSQ